MRASVTRFKALAAAIGVFAATTAARGEDERKATIRGRFVLESRKSSVPKTATMRLCPIASDNTDETVTSCEIQEDRWNCTTPIGTFDAEFYVSGFAPMYFWSVETSAAAPLDVPTVNLRPGANVTGKVRGRGREIDQAEIELAPVAAPESDAARSDIFTRRAMTDRQGFFSFADVGTGTYSIVARHPGYSTATLSDVRVEAPTAVRVSPLEILPLSKLDVFVMPPVDFKGEPWNCALSRAIPRSGYYELVRRGSTSGAGQWSAGLLESNRYRLQISTSRGESIESRDVELSSDSIVNVAISLVAVEGSITLGEEPVASSVVLWSEDGGQFTFRSNGDGIFAGFLPTKETWHARVRLLQPRLELHVDRIEMSRGDGGSTRVRIELPAGEVNGSVVDENRRPLVATVLLLGERGIEATTESGTDGKFRLLGLHKGERRIKAAFQTGESDLSPVKVQEDAANSVTLVVRSQSIIRGEVVDPGGNGIFGATVRYQREGIETLATTTGLAGEFSIPIVKGSPVVSFAVVAAGWPRNMVAFAADPAQPLRVVLPQVGARMSLRFRTAPSWPFITADRTRFFWLPDLFLPHGVGPPVEFREDRIWLELPLGTYTVCPEPILSERCASRTLAPNDNVSLTLEDKGWK